MSWLVGGRDGEYALAFMDDLKNRLDSDRRCFAFFHPRMPEEPLIFVEVALVHGMADNVQELLDETAPEQDPGRLVYIALAAVSLLAQQESEEVLAYCCKVKLPLNVGQIRCNRGF